VSKQGSSVETQEVHYPLGGPDGSPFEAGDCHWNLRELKDRLRGRRCFVIGNGPSINRTNMRLLKQDYTIGSNRIYLHYAKMGFEPTFYCAVNPYVLEQFWPEIERLHSLKFLKGDVIHHVRNCWNTFFMESSAQHTFMTDLENARWCEGWTVTFCALQLAFYLGFDEVILVGVDHHFKAGGTPNELLTASGNDPNHFHPNYFGRGVQWQYPDLERSEASYDLAKEVYERHGRRILDATKDGKLTLFPKVEFDSLFSPAGYQAYKSLIPEAGEVLSTYQLKKLGARQYSRGELTAAERSFRKALARAPGDSPVLLSMARISLDLQRYGDAMKYLRKALQINPNEPELWMSIAVVARHFGDQDTYESAKRRAKILKPSLPEIADWKDDS
jgi:tetratricopeptide (TPR) repeat protein